MGASGVLVDVLCDWQVSVKGSVGRSTCWYTSAFFLRGPSCPAPCRSPCAGAGAGVL